jgi:hypothetical protein
LKAKLYFYLTLSSSNLFLGRAYDKLNKPLDAEKAYNAAAKIKPSEDQAWQGLRMLYEGQGNKNVDEFITVSVRLAEIYAEAYAVAVGVEHDMGADLFIGKTKIVATQPSTSL